MYRDYWRYMIDKDVNGLRSLMADDYYQKCGFKNNYKALNSFNPFVKTNNRQITDGKKGKCNGNRN